MQRCRNRSFGCFGTPCNATEIAQARYSAGAANYLEVIDAQRSQLAIERLTVQIGGARRTATVALIRALGGGWEAPASLAVQE